MGWLLDGIFLDLGIRLLLVLLARLGGGLLRWFLFLSSFYDMYIYRI